MQNKNMRRIKVVFVLMDFQHLQKKNMSSIQLLWRSPTVPHLEIHPKKSKLGTGAPCDAMGGSSSKPVEESRQPQNLSCKVLRVCFPESSEVYIIIMTSLVMLTSKGEIQGWDRESEKELIYKRARKMESQLVKGVEKHSF